jgi:hypothetical protein
MGVRDDHTPLFPEIFKKPFRFQKNPFFMDIIASILLY